MKKIIIGFLCLFVLKSQAQIGIKDTANKFIIDINYETKEVNHYLQVTNKKKRQRPKIGSYIQIQVRNCPDSLTISGDVNFENGNLEGADKFIGFIKPEGTSEAPKPKSDETPEGDKSKKPIEDETKKLDEEINAESRKRIEASNLYKEALIETLNNKFNIDIEAISTSLAIDDVGRLLNDPEFKKKFKKIEKDPVFIKAKIDYDWQINALKIAQTNIDRKIFIRDSLLKELDRLNTSLKKQITKPVKPVTKHVYDIQVTNSDVSLVDIRLKDEKNNKEIAKIPLQFYNRGGYKIDFSTGFYFTKLQDERYNVLNVRKDTSGRTIEIDSLKYIKKVNDNSGKISVGILAHYYSRWYRYLNIGISGGFNYQLDDKIVNFLFGSSVLLGNQQRLVLTGGLAIGKVKVLDESIYHVDKVYDKSILANNTDIYTSKLRSKLFLGVAWNLGTLKETKSVSVKF